MIMDESGLHWQRIAIGDAGRGGHFTEYQCLEHPRLHRLVQRPNRDSDYVETYTVDGISAQHYHSAREALAAAKANP